MRVIVNVSFNRVLNDAKPCTRVTDTARALTYTQWGVTDDFPSVTASEKENVFMDEWNSLK